MNVVLFGAGASVGQAGERQPPITGQLYAALREGFPESWGSLPAGLGEHFAEDFEAGTTRLIEGLGDKGRIKIDWEKPSREVGLWRDLQWNLAEFFFRFEPTPGNSNLYSRFLGALSVSDLLSLRIATLNYDRLLQCAAHSRHIGICYSGAPNLVEPLAVCLPHGTSYFVPAEPWAKTENGLVFRGKGPVEIVGAVPAADGPLLELTSLEHLRSHRDQFFFPPAMSYINPDKWPGSGVSFLMLQQEIWSNWLRETARVVLVGVSVRSQGAPDAHLWEPPRTTKAQILCVSPGHANAFEQWAAACRRDGDEAIPHTWHDAFDRVIDFLRPA